MLNLLHSSQVIHEFVRGHFYGHYDFELDNTLYFFISGRHEYFNKVPLMDNNTLSFPDIRMLLDITLTQPFSQGVDMFIDALAGLNYLLKQRRSNMTVVAFIIMPSTVNNFNVESLKGKRQT